MYGSFDSIDELWVSAVEYTMRYGVKHTGRKGFETTEVLGPVLRLTNPCSNILVHAGRGASPIYGAGEFLWYMQGTDVADGIRWYAPSYRNYVEENGRAFGAYGERMFVPDQIRMVSRLLQQTPDTRQAIVSIWRAADLYHAKVQNRKDIPCTIAIQFLLRGGRLNCITTMRSNDIWLGLPYDVFCFTTLQHFIAAELGVTVGFYQHQPGSLHLYKRNYEAACIALGVNASPMTFHFEEDQNFIWSLPEVRRIEGEFRKLDCITSGSFELIGQKFGVGSRWSYLLAMALLNSSDEFSGEAEESAAKLIPEPLLCMAKLTREKRERRKSK